MPIRGFTSQGVIACFDEPDTTGESTDWFAPRNAPARDPISHLPRLTFHSSAFQYEIAAGPVNVTINHTALAGRTGYVGITYNGGWSVDGTANPASENGVVFPRYGQTRQTDITLFVHNLGYVPKVMVTVGGRNLVNGQVVQSLSGDRVRTVSIHVTTTTVFLREVAVSNASALTAMSLQYTVLVFRNRPPNPAQPLWGFDGQDLVIARDIIRSSRRYLRRVGVGDSPFSINLGRTIDIRNGGVRSATGGSISSETSYNGSFAAPPFLQVGV